MNFIYKGIAVLESKFHFEIKDWDFLTAGSLILSNEYWILTHCESQRQSLSRGKHETFNKWLASIVYANVQEIFSLFLGIFFVHKQYISF